MKMHGWGTREFRMATPLAAPILQRRKVDEEWKELLSWVSKWCCDHACTKVSFIRFFEFTPSHVQFLYGQIPSKLPNTSGLQFRKALKNLRDSPPDGTILDSVTEVTEDRYLSNLAAFAEQRVEVSFGEDDILIKCDAMKKSKQAGDKLQTKEKLQQKNVNVKLPNINVVVIEKYATFGVSQANTVIAGTATLLHWNEVS